jgi:hypothetical protein
MTVTVAPWAAVAVFAPSAQAGATGLRTLLVRSGEMPGFAVTGMPQAATGATGWVTRVEAARGTEARHDVHALRSAGFVAGVYEHLGPTNGGTGRGAESTVLQFDSAADARKQVGTQYALGVALQPQGAPIHPLRVGITGARGFTTPGSGAQPAAASNAYFSSGRCVFVVGDYIVGTHPNTAAPVVTAAKKVDARVGRPCR